MSKHDLRAGWSWVRFGDVAKQIKDKVDPEISDLERYVAGGHMDTDDLKIRRWGLVGEGYLGPAFHRRFQKGHILYGSRRTYLRKVAVADFDGICANTTFVIEARPSKIHPPLLPFIMQSEPFVEHSIKNSRGSTNPYVNWKDIAKYEFALPPLDEQIRIAELLTAVEESLEKWRTAINCTKKAKDRLAYELFMFSETRKDKPVIPAGYTTGTVENLAEINPSKPRNLSDDLTVSFIGMADVSDEGGIEQQEIKRLAEVKTGYTYFQEGDVLFAKITPCMENGKGALARQLENSIGFGSTEFHVLRATEPTDVDFIYQLTMSSYFRLRAEAFMVGTAGQKRVRADFLKKFFYFLIPPGEMRQKIGKYLSSFDTMVDEQKSHICKLREMKQVLLSTLLD